MSAFFESSFGRSPHASAVTPGRVNLLGEYVDFSAGMVLPTAVALNVRVALAPNTEQPQRDEIVSAQFSGRAAADVSAPAQRHWADYVRGALQAARARGWAHGGYCACIESELPHGSGLSTSAAVIVSVLKALAPTDVSAETIAVAARAVENDFIGVPCGIMDQMAVAVARPGQVLALDTLSLAYTLIDIPADWKFAVVHSGVSRALSDGRYGQRRDEILAAAAQLGVDWLCHADAGTAEKLPEPLRRRARHVIAEGHRAIAARAALLSAQRETFAALMNEGHVSIRDDFEITTPEVDAVVATAMREGVLAARQTGGGFGGCIVVLLDPARGDEWWTALNRAHPLTRRIV
jgi:galactokinase